MKRIVIEYLTTTVVAEVEIDAGIGNHMLPPIVVPRSEFALAEIVQKITEATGAHNPQADIAADLDGTVVALHPERA